MLPGSAVNCKCFGQQKKSAVIHSNRPLVFCVDGIKLYFCCVFWYWYFTRKKIVDITTNEDKPVCAVILSVRCVLSASKYMNKIKYRRRNNQAPVGMNICSFSATQEVCNKLENQAKCDSAVFVTNPLKIDFSHTFWLLELAIIARTNYNC